MRSPISETCRALISHLSGFLDGELDAALCEKIERHLASCPDCRVVADTTQKTIALYRGTRVAVPREVHAHLIQVLGFNPPLQQSHTPFTPFSQLDVTLNAEKHE